MSQFKKFRDFTEAKEKGLANNNGSIPNQDIPKPPKLPQHLKMDKTLAGVDYKGQMTTNPVKGTEENPLPYKGGEAKNKDQNKLLVHDDDVKSGFAFKGNKVQTPKNSASLGKEPELKIHKVKSKGKLTSEQFIEQTKGMSPAEFVSFFVEGSDGPLPMVMDLYGNEFTPNPNQTIQYMAALMVKNPQLLSRFVREMKRHDQGMHLLLDENFNHPEFYNNLAEGMAAPEEGRKRCHRISRAMNDQYMDALGKFMFENVNEEIQPKADLAFEDGGPMGSTPENPSGKAPPKLTQPKGGSMGGGGPGGELPPQPMQGGALGGGGGPQLNSPVPGGAFGGGAGSPVDAGMPGAGPDAFPPNSAGGIGGGPPPMPPGVASGGAPGLDMGTGGQPNMQQPIPKLKGETAHGNMIESMGGFPHILGEMNSFCLTKDCNKK